MRQSDESKLIEKLKNMEMNPNSSPILRASFLVINGRAESEVQFDATFPDLKFAEHVIRANNEVEKLHQEIHDLRKELKMTNRMNE
jgi:hypothetical protein